MIILQIGPHQKTFDAVSQIDERWVNQQINGRKGECVPVCVRLRIESKNCKAALSTRDCPSLTGGIRPPNSEERRIFELWEKHHLNDSDFCGGDLIAFLKQLAYVVHV